MKLNWTKGIKDEESKADIISAFKSSSVLRKRLAQILEEKVSSKQRECMNVSNYEKNSWAFQQADSQGYLRALAEILSLIEK
jgi:hypothetical protein